MNWFILANGLIYLAATTFSVTKGHYLYGVIWLCYGVSALVMFTMEGK